MITTGFTFTNIASPSAIMLSKNTAEDNTTVHCSNATHSWNLPTLTLMGDKKIVWDVRGSRQHIVSDWKSISKRKWFDFKIIKCEIARFNCITITNKKLNFKCRKIYTPEYFSCKMTNTKMTLVSVRWLFKLKEPQIFRQNIKVKSPKAFAL